MGKKLGPERKAVTGVKDKADEDHQAVPGRHKVGGWPAPRDPTFSEQRSTS